MTVDGHPAGELPDDDAALFDELYRELHAMAGRLFRSQRADHTLQPTALVHEAFLKLGGAPAKGPRWNDRAHFLAVAARAMRQVLVNHARDRGAAKRGGPGRRRLTLTNLEGLGGAPAADVLAVNDLLEELARLSPRQARVAELRTFAGLTNAEAAAALGVSLRTVELDWRMAKDWLAARLRPEGG